MTYVVVYAARLENGELCPDARGRCDKAIEVARQEKSLIVIGVGNPPGESSFRFPEAMVKYLTSKGWPEDQILYNPAGWSTLFESVAAREIIGTHALTIGEKKPGRIIAVSAWYHVPRIWLIWALALGRFVGVRASRRIYPWTNPFREILAFPITLWKIGIRALKILIKKGA